MIAPKVVGMAHEFPQAKFYKMDVDDVPALAQHLGVRAMPTFMFFKGGEKIGEVVGSNEKAVRVAVEEGVAPA